MKRRKIPPGSDWEARSGESIIYGLIHAILVGFGDLVSEKFNYLGHEIHQSDEDIPGLVFDGLTIKMASGDYKVTVERVRANG